MITAASILILVFVALCAICFAWARQNNQPVDDIQRENMRNLYGDNTK